MQKRKFKWDSDDSDDELFSLKKSASSQCDSPERTISRLKVKSNQLKTTASTSKRPLSSESNGELNFETNRQQVAIDSQFNLNSHKKARDLKSKIRFESCINQQTEEEQQTKLLLPPINRQTETNLIQSNQSKSSKGFKGKTNQPTSNRSQINRLIQFKERTVALTGEEKEWIEKQVKVRTADFY